MQKQGADVTAEFTFQIYSKSMLLFARHSGRPTIRAAVALPPVPRRFGKG
jgi:hypothetical protein